jgi:sterol desaturase/sphingolipid hydroxylase (fatty acid hydroxylase superfamily)
MAIKKMPSRRWIVVSLLLLHASGCSGSIPQSHRVHHAVDPRYHNENFADALPLFDILFGTYCHPGKDEFPATGLGNEFPAPKSLWSAQFGPVLTLVRVLAHSISSR